MSRPQTRRVEPGAADFPRRLAAVAQAPAALYVRGILRDHPVAVAIVGSRAATAEAIATAERLARTWAARGHLIVSGGALGVDGAAHRGALAAGGDTWVVLGCGADVAYPARHAALFDRIAGDGGGSAGGAGAVLSPFADGTPPLAGHFVRRNGVIAALADAVVVVAAEVESGSLHTARAAAALGRPVLAVPGTPGCDALLAAGAAPCEDEADLAAALAGRPRVRAAIPLAAASDEAQVHAALERDRALSADEVAAATGLPARGVAAALFELELLGLAIATPGRAYVRSTLAAKAC